MDSSGFTPLRRGVGDAEEVSDEPTPAAAGELQSYEFAELTPNSSYYAAMEMLDAEGNRSQISNMAAIETEYLTITETSLLTDFQPTIMFKGDVDGDGYDDVLVGGNFLDGTHNLKLHLFYGGEDLSLDNSTSFVAIDGEDFGVHSTLSDVNGDGKMDVLIYHRINANSKAGILIYYGKRFGDEVESDEADRRIWDDDTSFATAFADLGDIDGDGKSDIAVEDSGAGAGGYGQIRFYTGADIDATPITDPDLTPYTTLQAEGLSEEADFGRGIGSPGDLNADGYNDLVVSAPNYGIWDCGRTYVFFGSATGFTNTPGKTIDAPDDARCSVDGSSFAPWTRSRIGDIDGDGHPDLITIFTMVIDADVFDYRTKINIYSGGTSFAEDDSYEITFDDRYIFSIMPIGDTNGDGTIDVLFIDPYANNVLLGGTILNVDDGFVIQSEYLNIACGIAVDFNDDGLNELIVGNGMVIQGNFGSVEILH